LYLNINNCYDYSANLGEEVTLNLPERPSYFNPKDGGAYPVCEAQKYFIPLEIKNNGNADERYDIELKTPYSWTKLLNKSLAVEGGRKDYDFIYLETPAKPENKGNLQLTINSERGQIKKQLNLSIVQQNCNTPIIGKGKKNFAVRYSSIATIVPILNTGSEEATYELSLEADQQWISLLDKSASLKPGEKKDIKILTMPGNDTKPGIYAIKLNAKPRSGVVYSQQFYVTLSRDSPLEKAGKFISLYKTYFALGIAALVIIIILLLLFGKNIAKGYADMKEGLRKRKIGIEKAKEKAATEKVKNQIKRELKSEIKEDMKREIGKVKTDIDNIEKDIDKVEKGIKKQISKEAKKEPIDRTKGAVKTIEENVGKGEKGIEAWPFVLIIVIAIVAATLYYVFSANPLFIAHNITINQSAGNITSTTFETATTLIMTTTSIATTSTISPLATTTPLAISTTLPTTTSTTALATTTTQAVSTTLSTGTTLSGVTTMTLTKNDKYIEHAIISATSIRSFVSLYRWYILSAIIVLALFFIIAAIIYIVKNKKKGFGEREKPGRGEARKADAIKKAEKRIKEHEKKEKEDLNEKEKKREGKTQRKTERTFGDHIALIVLAILLLCALATIIIPSSNLLPSIFKHNLTNATTTTIEAPTTIPGAASTTLSNQTTLASTKSIVTTTLASTTTKPAASMYKELLVLGKTLNLIQDLIIKFRYYILAALVAVILIFLIAAFGSRNKISYGDQAVKESRARKSESKATDAKQEERERDLSEIGGTLFILLLFAALVGIIYLIHKKIGLINLFTKAGKLVSFVFMLAIDQAHYIIGAIALIILFIIIRFFVRRSRRKRETEAMLNAYSVGEDVTIPVNEKYGIGEISFRIKKKIIDGGISLRRLRMQPTFIRAAKHVYSYFEMNAENIDRDSLSNVLLRFRIRKSWIESRNINPKSVKIKRYEHREWQELPTKTIDEDDFYIYYETRLFDFSHYAIIGERIEKRKEVAEAPFVLKKAEIRPAKTKEPALLRETEIKQEKKKETTEKKKEEKRGRKEKEEKKEVLWPIYILILLAVAIFASVIYYNHDKLGSLIKITEETEPAVTSIFTTTHAGSSSSTSSSTSSTLENYWTDEILGAIQDGRYKYDSKGRVVDTKTGTALNNTDFAELLVQSKIDILEKTNLKLSDLDMLVSLLSPGKTVIDKGIPIIVVEMNNQSAINLSKYFYDPDGDKLKFNATAMENIAIMFDNNGGAIITPKKDFWGHESVQFTADDGKGGIVKSNETIIVVKRTKAMNSIAISGNPEQNKGMLNSLMSNISQAINNYYAYIIAGVVLVILLILILKFNEGLFSFPEEEMIKKEVEEERKEKAEEEGRREEDKKEVREKGNKEANLEKERKKKRR